MPNGEPKARLSCAVDDIDDTIKQIRSTIFDLRENMEPGLVRQVVVDLISEFSPLLGFTPSLRLSPGRCSGGRGIVGRRRGRTPRELANVLKHAHASCASIAVAASAAELTITIEDDGGGLPGKERRSDLANLIDRAVARGGTMDTSERDGGGTRIVWRAPID
jgi:signal transduction histidine kinase